MIGGFELEEFALIKEDKSVKFVLSRRYSFLFLFIIFLLWFLATLPLISFDFSINDIIGYALLIGVMLFTMKFALMYHNLYYIPQFIKVDKMEIHFSKLLNMETWPISKILFSLPKGEIKVKFREPIIEASFGNESSSLFYIWEKDRGYIEKTLIQNGNVNATKIKYIGFKNWYFSDSSGKKILLVDILKNYGGVTVIERPKMCLKPITRKNILKFVHSPIQGVDKLFEECDKK